LQKTERFLPYLCPPHTNTHHIYLTYYNFDIMPENTNQQPSINIELSEEVAEGIYSNLAIISHSNSEFVVDFIRLMPNVPKAKVKARIILTPQHAKRLLYALKDNLHKYEMQFGKIEEPEHPQLPPMNFNTPPAQA
jgi:hypothetical protein